MSGYRVHPASANCCTKLWGPAEVIVDEGTVHEYVDCARCHTICLIVDGKPVAKARAW